jgi:hypothetical protein
VTTINYSANADFHTLQITTAQAKSFPVCCVFTSRSLVNATNGADSSASVLTAPTEPSLHNSLTILSQLTLLQLTSKLASVITYRQ